MVNNELEARDTRLCLKCGSAMDEGFVIDNETYCCETCFPITEEKYKQLHDENPEEYYWTQWEDIYY